MKELVSNILPYSFRYSVRKTLAAVHFKRAFKKVYPHYQNRVAQYLAVADVPVLFAGPIKSGNTWMRFLLCNYFNIEINGATGTLTYDALNNKFQHNQLEGNRAMHTPPKGFLNLVRTHMPYNSLFTVFEKSIYLYRNPLDTLVSSFHFHRHQPNSDKHYLNDIDAFVLYYLPLWEHHVESYMHQKNLLHIRYEDIIDAPEKTLTKVLQYLNMPLNPDAVALSVKLSSFENIRQMGRSTNQQYGNGGALYRGEFTRKGKVGTFIEELKVETIQKASPVMLKWKFNIT